MLAPRPGWFRCLVAHRQPITPGDIIGELDVLGRTSLIIAPNIRGVAELASPRQGHSKVADAHGTSDMRSEAQAAQGERRAVSYGDVLLRVVAATTAEGRRAQDGAATSPKQQSPDDGLVFRAPTAGRFYARPSPDKAPFVAIGTELTSGTVVCLLEVMKTFTRVTYSGASARVRAVLVPDGADVTAGQPLLELESV